MGLEMRYGAVGLLAVASLALMGLRAKLGSGSGKPMPEFTMKTVDGKDFSNKDIQGRVSVFYVSGEGCGACEVAGPAVTRIFDSYPKKRVAVITGDAWNDTDSGATNLAKKLGVPAVVGIKQVQSQFGVRSVPFFVVVDRQGTVVFAESGFRGGQPIEDAVNQALVAK